MTEQWIRRWLFCDIDVDASEASGQINLRYKITCKPYGCQSVELSKPSNVLKLADYLEEESVQTCDTCIS